MVQKTMVISELELRIAERKAALAKKKAEMERLLDGMDVAILCAEFLCVFMAILFAVAGKPQPAAVGLLFAIYLKMRR